MNKEFEVLKLLAGLGIDVTPKKNSPDIEKIKARLDDYKKELGKLDPEVLAKYLG